MLLVDSDDESKPIEEANICTTNKREACKRCIRCCYILLRKHNMYSKTYVMLYKAYKILLTLSITQMTCERSFSKLNRVSFKTCKNT